MQSRRRLLRLVVGHSQNAPSAGSLQPPAAALQARPFTVLRLLSSLEESCSYRQPSSTQQQRQLAQQRRLSHYAASTSGRAAPVPAGGGGVLAGGDASQVWVEVNGVAADAQVLSARTGVLREGLGLRMAGSSPPAAAAPSIPSTKP